MPLLTAESEDGRDIACVLRGMVWILVGLLVAACAAPWVYRAVPRRAASLLALAPAAAFGALAMPGWIAVEEVVRWAPSFGLEIAFRNDGLARLLALLVSGIGAVVLVYAGEYMAGHPRQGRMLGYLLVFMAAMLGIAAADNLVLLFVFWELTSVSSFLLIGFDHDREDARAAALQALLVTGGGGLALLAGVLLLAQAGGTFSISQLVAVRETVQASPLYAPALLLILLAAFTKSAQVPFHFWLPSAMQAPTPVSAYLHSSTMVKAGVFLLARLYPVLGATALWIGIVALVGAVTALTGAVLAYRQTDLKRILAYSTVSALGVITLLLGLGGDVGVRAALLFLLAHAFYKGGLFLVAGAVTHATHERDITRLAGLGRVMPLTAVAAGVAALSMAGVPPLGGFLAKELMLEAVLGQEGLLLGAAAAVVVTSMLLTAVAVMVGLRPFTGPRAAASGTAHDGPVALWGGALLLAVAAILSGLAPGLFAAPLVDAAARAAGVDAEMGALHLWHGVTPALLLSALSLGGGALLAWRWRAPVHAAAMRFGPERAYSAALDLLVRCAAAQTHVLQSGYLHRYLLVTIAAAVVLVGGTLVRFVALPVSLSPETPAPYEILLMVLVVASTGVAVKTGSRLGAVAALGVTGYAVALIYLSFGAPDLAMTQVAIETLTVMLFLLALRNVPSEHFRASRTGRVRGAIVALGAGAVMSALVMLATTASHEAPVSGYFLERALPDGHGRNVVNVILVDFRALDTFGEIAVLSIAAVGVYALLRLRPGGEGARR